MADLKCPVDACGSAKKQSVGALAAHITMLHGWRGDKALAEARRIATLADVAADPFGLDRNGITKHEEPPRWTTGRTHQRGCP